MIELLCIDVDGTLTNGSLVYGYSLCGNLSLGMQFRTCENFGDFADIKSSLNPQNFHKYKSHTANTSIVCNEKIVESAPFCHTERSEVSKTRESNPQRNAMTKKRINESDSPLQQNDSNNLDSRVLDSSLRTSCYAQNDEFSVDSHESQSLQITEIAKVFNVKDGLAIAYWRKVLNRKVAIITGKISEILCVRANELQIPSDLLFMNVRDKGKIVRELKQRFALDTAQIASVGDDLNDISMFVESALNFAPNDCANAFKNSAKNLPNITILNAKGGCGAVRESIELILQKEKLYEKFIQYWQ